MRVGNFENLFDATEWEERIDELRSLGVNGACFYTDGGYKNKVPVPNTSWGIHTYFYNDDKPTKTSRYKIYYPTKEGYSDIPKEKSSMVNSVKVYDGSGLITFNDATNNIAEMQAVIAVLELILNTGLRDILTTVRIFSDSEYVLNVNQQMKKWKANGWKRSNGMIVANLEYWQHLDRLYDQLDEYDLMEVVFEYRKGHHDFGNIIADKLCSLAIESKIESNKFVDEDWYFSNDVTIPAMMLEQKYLHFPGLVENYSKFIFAYSLLDGTIPVSMLGCRLADISLSILEIEDDKFLSRLKTVHNECVGLEDVISPVPMVVDIKNVLSNSFDEYLSGKLVDKLPQITEIDTVSIEDPTNGKTVIQAIYPARNSFKLLDEFVKGVRTLERSEDVESTHIRKTDVTNYFFGDVTKKDKTSKAFLLTSEEAITIPVEHWVEGELMKSPATLTFGLDLPRRRIFFNLVDLDAKISVVTMEMADYSFKYFVLVETTKGRGFWFNPYSNNCIFR